MASSSSSFRPNDKQETRPTRGHTPPALYVRTNHISCDPCRKRKLRCDRVKPCSTCVRRGVEEMCYRDAQEEVQGGSTVKRARRDDFEASGMPGMDAASDNRESAPLDNGGSSSISDQLEAWRQQLRDMDQITRQSTKTLESVSKAVQDMEARNGLCPSVTLPTRDIVGSGRHGRIVWEDVCNHLPPKGVCEQLISFYFNELTTYIKLSQQSHFDTQWRRLTNGSGIDRTEAAIIFTAFAVADIMIPLSSTARRHTREDHHRWITLLGDPFASSTASLTATVDNSYAKIHQIALTSIYQLYTGRSDRLWEFVGVVMRKGIALGLFDERSRSWAGLDNLKKEYRRRLAWYMLVLDRWQSFIRQLPYALHPSNVYLAEATFESDAQVMRSTEPAKLVPNHPANLPDGRMCTQVSARKPGNVKFVQIELVVWCQEYLDHFWSLDRSSRYHRAIVLDEALERVMMEGLHNTPLAGEAIKSVTTAMLDSCPAKRQTEIIIWLSSIFFLRCIITRRFLTDDHAPANLRYISLTYAQSILTTIPSLTRLVKEGRAPVQVTWSANHLLAAATTFTVVVLGHDHYIDSQADPLDVSLPERDISYPYQQQIEWLADNIFTTVDCLDTLIQVGNHSAKTAKILLERLCLSQSDLRTLYRQRFNKAAGDGRQPHHRSTQSLGAVKPKSEPGYTQQHSSPQGLGDPRTPYRSNFYNTVMHASPSLTPTSATSHPYSSMATSVEGPDTSDSNPASSSLFETMSASSLLDAVLSDPTELDLSGHNNHSVLLASLLQDFPQQTHV